MVRKQFHAGHLRLLLQKFAQLADVLLAGVHFRDQGNAHDRIGLQFGNPADVFQDQPVADAGPGRMHRVVHMLDVHEHPIQQCDNVFPLLPVEIAAGFDGGVDPQAMTYRRQLPQELHLGEGFATRESDAAAGFPVKNGIPLDNGQHLINAHRRAHFLSGAGRTHFAALEAGRAFCPVQLAFAVSHGDGAGRADRGATAATAAAVLQIQHFRVTVPGFGVGAPLTTQRAAFEKDRAPNPFPVVDRPALDLEDRAVTWLHRSFFR